MGKFIVALVLFLGLTGISLASPLEDEISSDPLGRGYSNMDDAALLTSLNTKNRIRSRTTMTGREVRKQVNKAEYIALTNAKKAQLLSTDPFLEFPRPQLFVKAPAPAAAARAISPIFFQ